MMLWHAQTVGIYCPKWCQGHVHVLPGRVKLLLHIMHGHETILVDSRTRHGHIQILLGVHIAKHELLFREAIVLVWMAEEVRRGTSVHSIQRRRVVGDDRVRMAHLRER